MVAIIREGDRDVVAKAAKRHGEFLCLRSKGGRCRVHHAPPRQVDGEVRRAACRRVKLDLDTGRLRPGLVLAGPCDQFHELQFHLVEQSLAALGTRAKALASQLGELD